MKYQGAARLRGQREWTGALQTSYLLAIVRFLGFKLQKIYFFFFFLIKVVQKPLHIETYLTSSPLFLLKK